LLIPLAAVAWVAWRQTALQSELAALRADNAALQQLSATSTNQFNQVQQRQQELDATLQQTLQQELAASNAALAVQAQQLAALESEQAATRLRMNALDAGGGSPLAEAEMVLRFAQQRLVLARDVATALELFLAADELLRVVEDPAVVAVRATLAREVAALRAVRTVDVAGLFAQLSAQGARVEGFSVVSAAAVQDFSVTPSADVAAEQAGWWAGMKRALGDYFVVTRSTGAVLPQLDASEQFQLRALVQLQIEQAKLALLRAEPELYQSALDAAVSTSRRWLRSEGGSLESFIGALEALRDTPIVTDIPAPEQTLAALRQLSRAASVSQP
jgi:uroporphyrin-III C-methyltransferase